MIKRNEKVKKRHRMKGDGAMQVVSGLILLFVLIVVGYPVVYVISASFSSPTALSSGQVLLWPVNVTIEGYKFVLQYSDVWRGFRNSIIYTGIGVVVAMLMTIATAYPLSRPDLPGRKFLTKLLLVSSMFSAGLIPRFLIVSKLGWVGHPIAVITSGLIGVQSVIILRNAFSAIPQDLYDAAMIDGAHDFLVLKNVALPLTKASMSVLVLFSLVGCWNEYFDSLIFLRDDKLWPLQLVLRQILIGSENLSSSMSVAAQQAIAQTNAEQVKYVLIIVATVPVLAAYAVVQKQFKGGMMMGAVKG